MLVVCRGEGNMPAYLRAKKYLWQLIIVFALSLFMASPALAVDYTWDGGGDGVSWGDELNWNPDTSPAGVGPGVGDTVFFTAAVNIILGADRQVDGVTVNSLNATFTGANSLTTGTLTASADTTISMANAGSQLIVTGSFGHGGNDVNLMGSGTFSVQGTNSITGAGTIVLSAATTLFLNGNQQINMPDAATGGGTQINLTNNAMLNIFHTAAALDYQGTITGTGSLTVTGGGTVTLSGTNTYSGSTSIAGATVLRATGGGFQLPTTTELTVTSPGACIVDDQIVGSIAGNGTLVINVGTGLGVNEAGNGAFSGPITAGAGTFLAMTGAGSLTLTNLTSTAIVQVDSGTLVFNGITTEGVTVTGGTFMGTGTCGGALNIGAGTFAPGNGIGTFNVGNPFLMFGAGATLAIEVSGAAADQVNVTGAVNANNGTLNVTGGPTKGATFIIVNNDAGDAVAGTFNGLNEGDIFTSDGYQYQITYAGGTNNNDIVLTAITGVTPGGGGATPEPEPEPAPSGPSAPEVPQGSGPSPVGSLEGSTLTWPSVKGADHYRIYRADCPNCKRKAVGWVKETSFSDATAVAGKPYYYWLRSENSDGMGPYSNWMTAWRYEQNPGRAGDFNGDGIMDLLWWNPDNNQLSIWFMSNGQVTSVSAPGEALNINEWLLIATADFNGDGACDLLWWKPETGETQVWYLDKAKATAGGNGEWLIKSSVALDTLTGNSVIAYPGDLNGDGRSDILWRDHASGQVTLWLMGEDGKPQLNGPPTPANDDITKGERPGLTGTLSWQVVGLGDADANGRADVIWKDARNNRLAFWTMDASNISAVTQENKGLDLVWRSVGVGDLNGDSQADIVWRNEASGAVQAWLMQNGVFSEERSMLEGSDEATQWQVKAVGDFCAPGCDDVYCKNSETSAARIVTLDGGEFNPSAE